MLIAADLAAKARRCAEAVAGGAAVLAVCGGYQLLGRFYRDQYGDGDARRRPAPLDTVAGERRMIGDVLLECELGPASGARSSASRTTPAGRSSTPAREPLGRVVAGFGNDGESGFEGCRAGRVVGTYLHGPLLPRNPWLADWLLAQAVAHRTGGEPPELRAARRRARGRGARRLGRARARSRGGTLRLALSRALRTGCAHHAPAAAIAGRNAHVPRRATRSGANRAS